MPVAKGDQIYINPDTLDKTQEVEWSQKMQHRSGEYIVSRYSNKTRGMQPRPSKAAKLLSFC